MCGGVGEVGRRSAVCFPYCLLVMSISFYYSQFISIGPGINRNCILIKAVPFSFGCSFGAFDKVNGLSINLCKQWETSRRLSVPSSFNESFFGFPANWWLWELIAKRHFMMIRFSLIERLCWRPFAIETQLADCRLDWIGWGGWNFGLESSVEDVIDVYRRL